MSGPISGSVLDPWPDRGSCQRGGLKRLDVSPCFPLLVVFSPFLTLLKLLKRLTAVRSRTTAPRCWFPAGRLVPPPGCAEPSRWAGTLRCALRVSAAKTTEALRALSPSASQSLSTTPLLLSLSLSLPLLSLIHTYYFSLCFFSIVSPLSPHFLCLSHSVCFPPPCWRSLFLFSDFIWFKWSLLTLSKSIQCVLTTRLPLIPAVISYIRLFDLWKNRIAHSNTSLSNYFCVRLLSHKNLHYMRINKDNN